MSFVFKFLLPGILLIVLGFLAGAQKNIFLSFFGFISFFIVGITLIIEGWKSRHGTGGPESRKENKDV